MMLQAPGHCLHSVLVQYPHITSCDGSSLPLEMLPLGQWSPHSHCFSLPSAAHLVPELVSHPPLLLHLEHHLFKPLLSPPHQLAREDALPEERHEGENQKNCSPGVLPLPSLVQWLPVLRVSGLCPPSHPPMTGSHSLLRPGGTRLPPGHLILDFS